MGKRIEEFNKEDYTYAVFKPEKIAGNLATISADITRACDELDAINEIFNRIISKDFQSSDWGDTAQKMTQTIDDIKTSLRTSTESLLNDINDKYTQIAAADQSLAASIAEHKATLQTQLESFGGKLRDNTLSGGTTTNPQSTAATPTPTPAQITQVDSTIDTSLYSGNLHSKGKATADSKAAAGTVTTGNQGYQIVADGDYTKAPGTISQSDYNLLIAQVAGESANNPDDMLGVTCTILNRLEAGGGYGSSVTEVLEKGYFPWGRTYQAYVPGGKYYNTDWGQDKLEMVTQVVNDALAGARNVNSNVYYYSGDGTNNYFSDVL